jgi:hypothetical protein
MPYITDLGLTITPSAALYTQPVADGVISVNESSAQGRKAIVLDFNNSEGLYVRDLGTILQWPTSLGTVLDIWQPSIIPLDDDVYDRLSFHFLMKSLGGVGWQHVREMNIPFASTTDLTLLLTFGVGAVPASITLNIPNSGGQETKTKVTLPPNKFKIAEGFLSSTQPFKLWGSDLELKIKSWGSSEPYRIVRPMSG